MIKWLSGSRLKTGTESNESHSAYPTDPLAAANSGIGNAEGKCQFYAISRSNPLFVEEEEEEEEEEASPVDDSGGTVDLRLSPRKSISSGYESRCNSSDSSSCAECEEAQLKKSVSFGKREKRLTKQNKSEKKKRGGNSQKWVSGDNRKSLAKPNAANFPQRAAKIKNGSSACPSLLATIPEGKVDSSIPPPIWPRLEEQWAKNRKNLKTSERIYHNGSTSPVNFMFKYNERYPVCFREGSRTLLNFVDEKAHASDGFFVKAEYEQNWVECSKIRSDEFGFFVANDKRERFDRAKIDSIADGNQMTQEALGDLASLIAYAMSKKNSLPLDSILRNLAESIQKSLDFLSRVESENDLKSFCENLNRNQYLSKMLTVLLTRDEPYRSSPLETDDDGCGGSSLKNAVDTNELSLELQNFSSTKSKNSTQEDVYSSGSEGKNSSSFSSGCKDLYMSSNSSSSADKENVFSARSFESGHGRENSVGKEKGNSSMEVSDRGRKSDENRQEINLLKLIRHQRDFSSSSSTESAFGSSDISPPSSESSSAQGGVLSPVFFHENIYSVSKGMRNAIICEGLNRTVNADRFVGGCGSIKNCSGSSDFEKLISAKRKTSRDSQLDESIGSLTFGDEERKTAEADDSALKKIEHPYYISIGRPDFTLDLPQAEKLMKKIDSSKRRRCWCRFTTSILGLVFFLLSVMMVSLVITKGRRMFGAL